LVVEGGAEVGSELGVWGEAMEARKAHLEMQGALSLLAAVRGADEGGMAREEALGNHM
jgi:hypothetical protein